jgi:hypothetical protein
VAHRIDPPSPIRLNVGYRWNCNHAFAGLDRGRHAKGFPARRTTTRRSGTTGIANPAFGRAGRLGSGSKFTLHLRHQGKNASEPIILIPNCGHAAVTRQEPVATSVR